MSDKKDASKAKTQGLKPSEKAVPELALGWDVDVTGDYTLAVDGVSTTPLTPTSTLAEIESALNETSGPVGLDVTGDPATVISVSTDTPAELTATGGATVTVTEPAVIDEVGDIIDLATRVTSIPESELLRGDPPIDPSINEPSDDVSTTRAKVAKPEDKPEPKKTSAKTK